jgi:transglutaminase-like putative cysteine protease
MIDLTGLSNYIGASIGNTFLVLIAVAIIIYLIQKSIKNEQTRLKFIVISILTVIVLLAISGAFSSIINGPTTIKTASNTTKKLSWQEDYAFQAKANLSASYETDIENTAYYDYDNKVIKDIAYTISSESRTSNEAIIKTLNYVYTNVDYVYGESDDACFTGTAPSIITSGKGQCDTQSIAVISILRKMGIAAKPAGGCIVVNSNCKLQAMFQSIGVLRPPMYTELTAKDVVETKTTFSRTVTEEDLLSRQGGLHAWVVAWLPDQGWVALEATNGQKADTNCYYYHVELYPQDANRDDICVSKNRNYAKACQLDDLTLLNQYGLGIVTEVSP